MRRRPLSVRARLSLWYSGALALTMLLFAVAIYTTTRLNLARNVDQQLDQLLEVFETVIQNHPEELTDAHELSEIEAFGVISLFRVSVQDRVVHETVAWRRSLAGSEGSRDAIGRSWPWTAANGQQYYLKTAEIRAHGFRVQIAAAVDGSPTRNALRSVLIALLIGLPCSLVLSVLGGHFLAGRVLSPLGTMAAKAQGITAEQLSHRLPVENPNDELGRLAVAFNSTLARLEDSFRQLKQFTADASHELRTPLTALRSVGEVGLQKATKPDQLREVIGSMLEDADRLTQLVDALLTLTRSDYGKLSVSPSTIDLGEMAETVAQDLAVLAEEKNQSMAVHITEPASVEVDPSIFRLALINILDNAIKYTQANGRIQITVECDTDAHAVVSIKDNGPGIPPSHRDRIFDRFVRVDDGRSSAIRGVGLGLSIAQWATEIHGGQLEMESEEGVGSVFRIMLPLSDAEAEQPPTS